MVVFVRCFYLVVIAGLMSACVGVAARQIRTVQCYDLKVCQQNSSVCQYDAKKKAYYQEMSKYSCSEAGGHD